MTPKKYVESATQTEASPESIANDAPIEPLAPPKKIRDTTWMMTNVNEEHIVASIGVEDIQQSANEVTSKGGYELLCSYSWKQTDSPTIYVPGTPATFMFQDPRAEDILLEADTGVHWIDQHAERVPKHQFEPVFQALAVQQPGERFDNVDIIVNRGSLQQLLKWVNNKSSQAFHLDKVASMANSFGRNFEDFFTAEDPELEDAEGHHRALKYDFGGLNMIIRVEEDAYLPNTEYDFAAPIVQHPAYVPEDSCVSSIAHTSPVATTVIPKGTLIPQSLMVKLKSNDDSMPKEQMWFGRTLNCALGKIEKPKKGDVTQVEATAGEGTARKLAHLHVKSMDEPMIEKWEKDYQEGLRKLVWLLQRMREVVKEGTEDASAVLVSLGKGEPLAIYATKERVGALPQEIIDVSWNL